MWVCQVKPLGETVTGREIRVKPQGIPSKKISRKPRLWCHAERSSNLRHIPMPNDAKNKTREGRQAETPQGQGSKRVLNNRDTDTSRSGMAAGKEADTCSLSLLLLF